MGYRLVSYSSHGKRYLQIIRDVKKNGWTTTTIVHLADTELNREKAEELIAFLKKHASKNAPVAIGTVDDDFLAGLRLGMLLGPLSLPIAPILLFRDFVDMLSKHIAMKSGSIENIVNATQAHLSESERLRLVEWIRSIPDAKSKAIALYFKWSWE